MRSTNDRQIASLFRFRCNLPFFVGRRLVSSRSGLSFSLESLDLFGFDIRWHASIRFDRFDFGGQVLSGRNRRCSGSGGALAASVGQQSQRRQRHQGEEWERRTQSSGRRKFHRFLRLKRGAPPLDWGGNTSRPSEKQPLRDAQKCASPPGFEESRMLKTHFWAAGWSWFWLLGVVTDTHSMGVTHL